MKKRRKRKCKYCEQLYSPDPRTHYHQRYCSKPECQKARHRNNQARWLARPENKNYFRGKTHVERVQAWRKAHPGYGRKKDQPLQDVIDPQPIEKQRDKPDLTPAALQDAMLMQPAVLVGFISALTGSALQDEIARHVQSFHHRGQQILRPPEGKGNGNEGKSSVVSETITPDTGSV